MDLATITALVREMRADVAAIDQIRALAEARWSEWIQLGHSEYAGLWTALRASTTASHQRMRTELAKIERLLAQVQMSGGDRNEKD
jgi:hypothetical protein